MECVNITEADNMKYSEVEDYYSADVCSVH